MIKSVVSLSGGLDSATLLAYSLKNFGPTLAVGFTYGSKHNPFEQECAKKLANHYGVEFLMIDLASVGASLKSNLLSSGGDIPEGHYQAENMKLTVVPGRNMIFASILAGIAVSRGANIIALGIHAGDHAIYPDCRPGFFAKMRETIHEAMENQVDFEAPFILWNKSTILSWGLSEGVPYNITRTCYKDQPLACGKCGACQERLEAFKICGEIDPIPYYPANC